jgi:hypothetical protein
MIATPGFAPRDISVSNGRQTSPMSTNLSTRSCVARPSPGRQGQRPGLPRSRHATAELPRRRPDGNRWMAAEGCPGVSSPPPPVRRPGLLPGRGQVIDVLLSEQRTPPPAGSSSALRHGRAPVEVTTDI